MELYECEKSEIFFQFFLYNVKENLAFVTSALALDFYTRLSFFPVSRDII